MHKATFPIYHASLKRTVTEVGFPGNFVSDPISWKPSQAWNTVPKCLNKPVSLLTGKPLNQSRFDKTEHLGYVVFTRNAGMIAASEVMAMTRRPCRNYSSAFKAKVSVATIKGENILIELAQGFEVHLDQLT
jgi:hypothetical protein